MRGPAAVALALAGLLIAGGAGAEQRGVVLATTTSVRDSGLLDELLPPFTARTGIPVQVIAVGSGAALRMGSRGDADLLITHAPERERELVDQGAVLARRELMENYFVLAGPPGDPADVRGATTVAEAYRRLRDANASYVSRDDQSGTHMRERALLRAAGLEAGANWEAVLRTGSGMGLTLQVAGERRAYVLSDLGTFLAFRDRIGLEILSRPTPELRNVYSVMRVSPKAFPGRLNEKGAAALEAYLFEPDTLLHIASVGVERFGRPLFVPLP